MTKDKVINYDLYQSFKTDKEEMGVRFAEFRVFHLLERIKPVKGAVAGIKKLIKKGFIPHFVTARPQTIEAETRIWLKTHFKNIEFPIHFTHPASKAPKRKKSKICREIGAKALIDDNLDNAIDCAQNGIKVFLMDAPWNQTDSLPENIIRVKSWEEILEKIDKVWT